MIKCDYCEKNEASLKMECITYMRYISSGKKQPGSETIDRSTYWCKDCYSKTIY